MARLGDARRAPGVGARGCIEKENLMSAVHRRPLLAAALLISSLVALAGAPASAKQTSITGSLTTSTADAAWSEYVTLTATLTVPTGTPKPTGPVEFRSGSSPVGTAELASGVARLRTKTLDVGTHQVTASYGGAPVAGPVPVTVYTAQTTTTLVSRKPEVLSGTAWFQATVAPDAPATTAPTGSVAFTVDGAPAATVPLASGIATWRPRLDDGLHIIRAIFQGTDRHDPSTSGPLLQDIGPPGLPGTIDQSNPTQDDVTYARVTGQTFTAGVTGLLDQVSFTLGQETTVAIAIHAVDGEGQPTGPPLGSKAATTLDGPVLAPLDLPAPVQSGRQYALVLTTTSGLWGVSTDVYAGGHLWAGGQSWYPIPDQDLRFATYVRPAPTPASTITSSAAATVWSEYVNLTASWTIPVGSPKPTGTVRFLAGAVEVGTAPLSNGTARLRTKALPAGTQTVTATYDGDGTYPAGPVGGSTTISVAPATTTTTLVSRRAEVLSGPAWFQATVAPVDPATKAPTGTVEFYLDGYPIPEANLFLSGGIASWRPRLSDGPHTVTASYVGSDESQTSASAPVAQHIGTPPPASALDQSNTGSTIWRTSNPGFAMAQTFTVGATGMLDRVTLEFPRAGQSYTLLVGEFAFGAPMGFIIDQSGATGSGPTTIELSTPVPVEAGQTFYISVEGRFSSLDIGLTEDTYTGGTALAFDPWTGTWETMADQDMAFTTYVRPT